MKELREMTKLKGTWKLPQSRTVGTGPVPVLWYGITLLILTAVYFGTGHFGLSFSFSLPRSLSQRKVVPARV
jgi:hypothetical protein